MRLRPVTLVFTFALGLLAAPLPAEAQRSGKVYRIGYLSAQSHSAELSRLDGFRQALRDLGYVEGKNIVIKSRYAEGKTGRLPELAAELICLKVDVMVTGGTAGTRAAKQATKTIPLIMTLVGNPIRFSSLGDVVGGNEATSAGHVLHNGNRISRDVLADVARRCPCIGVITSPRRIAYDETDGFALVKFFTKRCGRSTDKNGKANEKFNQA